MKREEMIERLGYLRVFCEESADEDDTQALTMAIDILEEGYIDDVAYIKDLVNFIFIFLGFIALLMLIIVCRL